MKTFLLSFGFSVLLLAQAVVPVQADLVRIPIDCSCFEKEYQLYAADEHSAEDRTAGTDGQCSIAVELEPTIDESDVRAAAEENAAASEEGGGVGDSLAGVGSASVSTVTDTLGSIASPLSALFEQSGIKRSFVRLMKDIFEGHTEKYHAFMDEEVFGKPIAFLSSFETSEALEEYLSDQDGECEEDEDEPNPKPQCVVEKAMCNYEKYVGVLFHQSGQSVANAALETKDIDTLVAVLANRDQALLQEAQHAQVALDTTIGVYAQFFQTYRLHLRFKELIVHLAKVRNLTGHMSTLVGCIPNKFVGVATTKCD